MTRAITQFTDKTGRAHPTMEDALTADLAALLGSVAYAEKIMARRTEVLTLLSELPAQGAEVVQLRGRK